ncbi:MAG: outer membrane beta-barrel protein [Halofilum sp. (in: g-proteobacteria)]|nr:outer membrane beta-barrel protein [Halofilum sp. (in: g-proteobacteria)]
MNIRLLLALALAAAPLTALAEQPGKYWGLSIADAEVTDQDGISANASNVGLHLGYHLTDFLGVELQTGTAASGVSGDRDTGETRYAGAFARFDLPFKQTNVFFLAGAAAVEYDEGPPEDLESESDVAAGFGVELYGSERTAVRLEYMNYADDTYETFGIGFVHHFDFPRFR